MHYYLYSIDSYKNVPEKLNLPGINGGCVIFYTVKEEKFFYVYSVRSGRSVTPYPWRRGVRVDQWNNFLFLSDFSTGSLRRIRRDDFKIILNALKKAQRKNAESITVHWSGDLMMIEFQKARTEKIFHIELAPEVYRKIYEAKDIIYQTHAKESRDHELGFSETKYAALRIRKVLFDANPHLSVLFRRLDDFSVIRISSFQYTRIIALKYILFDHRNIILMLPRPVDFFNKFRVFHKRNKDKQIKRILVFTNLNGEFLENLNTQIDFWSRGETGFIWKHVYGKLSSNQLKKITRNHFDMVIYRGHSRILNRKITWPLAEGDVPMDQFFSESFIPNYIHLACNEMDEARELESYPFDLGMMPVTFLPDMDYSVIVRKLLQNIEKSHSVLDSMRKAIEVDSRFQNLFAIWQ